MAWSISYTSTTTSITFNVCAGGSTTGGYFYILMPDSTVLPSTLNGIKLASNTCTTFVTQSSEYTQPGGYTMVLADQTAPEPTMAQVWFGISSPFAVVPPSGNSSGGGGGGGGGGVTCTTPGDIGIPILNMCVSQTYLLLGAVIVAGGILLMKD